MQLSNQDSKNTFIITHFVKSRVVGARDKTVGKTAFLTLWRTV